MAYAHDAQTSSEHQLTFDGQLPRYRSDKRRMPTCCHQPFISKSWTISKWRQHAIDRHKRKAHGTVAAGIIAQGTLVDVSVPCRRVGQVVPDCLAWAAFGIVEEQLTLHQLFALIAAATGTLGNQPIPATSDHSSRGLVMKRGQGVTVHHQPA